MKKITLLALAILTVGCHLHEPECHYNEYGDIHCHDHHDYTHHSHEDQPTTVVYATDNNGGGSNNIIIVEEQESYCMWDSPYYHDPEYCTFDGLTCCTWLNIGEEEEWCYTDYCGWELYSVYTYY